MFTDQLVPVRTPPSEDVPATLNLSSRSAARVHSDTDARTNRSVTGGQTETVVRLCTHPPLRSALFSCYVEIPENGSSLGSAGLTPCELALFAVAVICLQTTSVAAGTYLQLSATKYAEGDTGARRFGPAHASVWRNFGLPRGKAGPPGEDCRNREFVASAGLLAPSSRPCYNSPDVPRKFPIDPAVDGGVF